MKLLVVGGCGFLGSNLASHGIELGWDVTIFDNLSRVGSTLNLQWLQSLGKVTFIHGDTRNKNDVECLLHIVFVISTGNYLPPRGLRPLRIDFF